MPLVLDGDTGIVGVLLTDSNGNVTFDTNTLYVDAPNNRVGIGTTAPNYPLEVEATATTSTDIVGFSNSNGIAKHIFGLENVGAGTYRLLDSSNNNAVFFSGHNADKSYLNVGDFGIGTTNPVAPLVVSNGGASGIELHPEIASNFNRITNYNRSASAYNDLGIDALEINLRPSGVRKFTVNASETVVNPDSQVHNFRVSSDTNANMIFVDGTNNRVGIGTNSPDTFLQVGDGVAASNRIRLFGPNGVTVSAGIQFYVASTEYLNLDYDSNTNKLEFKTDTTFGNDVIFSIDRENRRVEASDYHYNLDIPNVEPFIMFDFGNSRSIAGSGSADVGIDFTRTQSAPGTSTYINEAGLIAYADQDEPRFHHDPTTGECRGLLIEDSATNWLPYSSLANSSWNTDNCTKTADNAYAPDGTYTATRITATGSSAQLWRGGSNTAGGVQSVFIKAGTHSVLGIYDWSGGGGTPIVGWFDASAQECKAAGASSYSGLNTTSVGTNYNAYMEDYGNGWYRCHVTRKTTGQNMVYHHFRMVDRDASSTSSSSGHYMWWWGAHTEAFGVEIYPASTYIPTNGSSVTRSNDQLEVDDVYLMTPMTIHWEGETNRLEYARRIYGIVVGGGEIRPLITNNGEVSVYTTFSNLGNLSGISATINRPFGIIHRFQNTTHRATMWNSVSGSTSSAETSGGNNRDGERMAYIRLGYSSAGDNPRRWCGVVKKFAIYRGGLTNDQMTELVVND